jgi:membrane protease YdiL (CAAX protease family)
MRVSEWPWWTAPVAGLLAGGAAGAVYLVTGSLAEAVLGIAAGAVTLLLVYDGLARRDITTPRAAVSLLVDIRRPRRSDAALAAGILVVSALSRVTIGTLGNLLIPTSDRAGHAVTAGAPPPWWALVALAVGVVFVGPLVEEVVFRGVIQRFLGERVGVAAAIAATTALFAALHVPQYGGLAAGLGLAVPTAVIVVDSTLWGLLYERTGSVVAPALAHGSSNALALVLWVT